MRETQFGRKSLEFYYSYSLISRVYYVQQQWEQAQKYYNRQLESYRQLLKDEDHTLVADTYEKLGEVLYNQKIYEEAVKFHLQALEIRYPTPHEAGIYLYADTLYLYVCAHTDIPTLPLGCSFALSLICWASPGLRPFPSDPPPSRT